MKKSIHRAKITQTFTTEIEFEFEMKSNNNPLDFLLNKKINYSQEDLVENSTIIEHVKSVGMTREELQSGIEELKKEVRSFSNIIEGTSEYSKLQALWAMEDRLRDLIWKI